MTRHRTWAIVCGLLLLAPLGATAEDGLWTPKKLDLPELEAKQTKSKPERRTRRAPVVSQVPAAPPADLPALPSGLPKALALQHARYLEQTASPFTAAAALLAAERRGKLDTKEPATALLLANWYQQLGLYNRAGALAHEFGDNWPDDEHNRFWLAQARVWLRRGAVQQAEQALLRLRKPFDKDTEEARQSLLASALMHQQRYAAAVKELEDKQGVPRNSVFDRYNRGVALVGLGRIAEGMGQLDELGQIPAEDEAMLALRDRANLALGWAWLAADQGATARPLFKRVRQDGIHANMALLGLGWAEIAPDGTEQERIYTRKQLCNEDQLARLPGGYFRRPARDDCNLDKLFVFKYRAKFSYEPVADATRFEAALKPWLLLGQRKARDPAVQEALLAAGFAYEQMGARAQAQAAYQRALTRYQEELKRLAKFAEALRGPEADPLAVLGKQAYRDEFSEWRSSQAFDQAVTDMETLQRCAKELAIARGRMDKLRPGGEAQRKQLAQLRGEWSRQQETVSATRAALRAALQKQALAQVDAQRERLNAYLLRARIALAGVYERTSAQ